MTEPAVTDPRVGHRPERVPPGRPALAFALLATLYAAVSIQQYHRMDSFVFDLGFFESVVRDYAHGRLPELPLTDTTDATLHFSPALAVLAPLVMRVALADRDPARAGGGRRGRGGAADAGRRRAA